MGTTMGLEWEPPSETELGFSLVSLSNLVWVYRSGRERDSLWVNSMGELKVVPLVFQWESSREQTREREKDV